MVQSSSNTTGKKKQSPKQGKKIRKRNSPKGIKSILPMIMYGFIHDLLMDHFV
jgi:hypothetical protein